MREKRILVVGGGLAGLVAALHLSREGILCTVIEKHRYPFHRVCGEYISNEVEPYLNRLEAYPLALRPARISRFQLSSTRGATAQLELDMGGFGISRYVFDHFLYQLAMKHRVRFLLETEVTGIRFGGEVFSLDTSAGLLEADLVVAAHGKRSRVDKQLQRDFVSRSSPYVGVKYHIALPGFPDDLIALHNFSNGYCGISRVENDTINLCYLTHRDNVRAYGNLRDMEEAVLFRNPIIQDIFNRAKFLLERPETINEISFETKRPVENHVLFCGDAAGMIAPLCGNGMAMAIHGAKLAAERIVRWCREPGYSREHLEQDYGRAWNRQFARRLWFGRNIQKLFGGGRASGFSVQLARRVKPVANLLVSLTHGKPF